MGGNTRTPYTTLTIAKKMELLQDIDQKIGAKGDLAKKYGIARSSLSTILKNRQKIEAIYYKHERHRSCQRLKSAKNRKLESHLFCCISHMQKKQGQKITGSMMKEKALVLANLMNISNFTASNGWLTRFKKRYNISTTDMYNQDIAMINPMDSDDDDGITILLVNHDENEKKEPEELEIDDESEQNKQSVLAAIRTIGDHLSEIPQLPKNIDYSFNEVKQFIIDDYKNKFTSEK